MDALVAAAKKEGALNVIALPPDWTNYGEVISTFEKQYGLKVNSAQPDGSSQEEINAASQLKGTDRAPDVFDLSPTVATANTAIFAKYQVSTWADVPAALKESSGTYVNDYGGFMSIGYDAGVVPAPTSVQDLLKPEYKGKVALNGDPTQAGAAFSGVAMTALGVGGSADDIAPGVDFYKKLKAAGNFLPVDPTPATIAAGQTPVVIDWDYTNAAQSAKLAGTKDWKVVVPGGKALVGLLLRRRRSTRTPRTRPLPGCGRSSSTPTRARTSGSRASAGRSAPTPWRRPARSTRTAFAKLPPAEGDAVSLTPDAEHQGQGLPQGQLGEGRQLTEVAAGSGSRALPGSAPPPHLPPDAPGCARGRCWSTSASCRSWPSSRCSCCGRRSPWSAASFSDGAGGLTLANLTGDLPLALPRVVRAEPGAVGDHGGRRGRPGCRARLGGRQRTPRPRCCAGWSTSAAGVLAQFGGVTLAFAFLATIGFEGLVTIFLRDTFGVDVLSGGAWIFELPGLVLVYSYFQIPLMVIVFLPALDGLRPQWREASESLGGTSWTYLRHVAGPILLPAFLGSLLLLFANAFSAYATAAALISQGASIVPLQIRALQTSEVLLGQQNLGKALGLGMVVVVAVVMALYAVLQRRTSRWLR